jgi:SAM-dependent methyltransferase
VTPHKPPRTAVQTIPFSDMALEGERPLYHEFAWAYDLLFDDEVGPFIGRVAEVLAASGVRSGSRVLDAGCGTGRYAAELARPGFVVDGIDVSPELVAYGRKHNVPDGTGVRLDVGDLRNLAASEALMLSSVEVF